MSSATLFFPATFLNVFAELVFLANIRGAVVRYLLQKRSEVKTRNEKHGFVTSFSAVSLYMFLLLISFGVTLNSASGVN